MAATQTKQLCPSCARVAYGRLRKMLGVKASDQDARTRLVQALADNGGHLKGGCVK